MGIEYRVSCTAKGLPKIGELLLRLGGQPSSQFPTQIEFRFRPCGPDEMPDATVVVESEGIYFLDGCGGHEQVAVLFRRIVDEALTFSDSSDSVVITSL
jgi:hypothetical protein